MGVCYSVNLDMAYKKKGSVRGALIKFIDSRENTVFPQRKDDDLDSLLLCLFPRGTSITGGYSNTKRLGRKLLKSDFDASYSWKSVMYDAFDAIAPFLKDGSIFECWPDNDYVRGVVKDGEVEWNEVSCS